MRKRKNRSRGLYATETQDEPCRESLQTLKLRAEAAKETLDTITSLAQTDAFDYEVRDEIVGKAYMNHLHAKQELRRRKAE